MALRSTVYKAELSIADIDRGRYASHALTLALHPSETEERLMLRLLAFVLFADDALSFGRGLSAEDEPDLLRTDDTGAIRLWVEVGLPDERWVRKACGRAAQVVVVAPDASAELAATASRAMTFDVTVQEGQVWFAGGPRTVTVEPRWLRRAAGLA
jgi:uncharacterized protein YaeQ